MTQQLLYCGWEEIKKKIMKSSLYKKPKPSPAGDGIESCQRNVIIHTQKRRGSRAAGSSNNRVSAGTHPPAVN